MTLKTALTAFAACFLVSTLLVACGGSGGGGSDPKPTGKTGTVGGVAFDAELVGATVSVSNLDSTLWFGDAVTDSDGRFSVTLNVETDRDQVLRVSTKGGSFVDEYTGETRQEFFGQTQGSLRMYVNYTPGTSIQLAPTIYTTLASYLADYLIEQGLDHGAAVSQANASVSSIVGVDIEKTIPHNITKAPADASTDSLRYGFYSAAICALMAGQDALASSISFTNYAKGDIRDDGLLNESVTNVWEFSGGYRHALAVAMLKMAASDRNSSGLSLNDVLLFAQDLNNNAGALFAGADSPALESEKPLISNIRWNNSISAVNNPLSGTATLSFGVGDLFGIQSLRILIDGIEVADLASADSALFQVDTRQLADGDHQVKIVASNIVGNVTEDEHRINTANFGTSISNFSIVEGKTYQGRVTIHSEVRDPTGIVQVDYFIDGSSTAVATFDDGDIGTYEWQFFTPAYADGPHTLRIVATNGVGIKAERAFQFTIDNTAPTYGIWLPENAFVGGSAKVFVTHEPFAQVQLSVAGVQGYLESSGTENGVEWKVFVVNTQTLSDGPQTLSFSVSDSAGNVVTKKQGVIVDNTLPSVRITYPLTDGHIAGEFYLSWVASDANGFAENPFEILIDDRHYSWVSNWEITDSINPEIFGAGLHAVTIQVTDASGKVSKSSQYVYFDI